MLYGEFVAESTRIGESMPLPRLQLLELEDLTWFPHTIRDLATDYLHFMETRFALHKPVVPLLRAMLENSKTSCVVDLCSGAGGPVLAIYEALAADEIHVQFTLTDKFPNTHCVSTSFLDSTHQAFSTSLVRSMPQTCQITWSGCVPCSTRSITLRRGRPGWCSKAQFKRGSQLAYLKFRNAACS